jgi:hypothetical protein
MPWALAARGAASKRRSTAASDLGRQPWLEDVQRRRAAPGTRLETAHLLRHPDRDAPPELTLFCSAPSRLQLIGANFFSISAIRSGSMRLKFRRQ